MKPPRKHHTVPRMYLKRFASGGKVQVCDLAHGKWRRESIDNLTIERDFNRIEVEGYDPNHYEFEFQKLETKVDPILDRIVETHLVPKRFSAEYADFINFIALMIVRTRKFRHITTSVGVNYELLKGLSPDTYELINKLGEPDRLDANWHMANMIAAYHSFVDQLSTKSWIVLVPSEPKDKFVTSDHPFSKLFGCLLFPISSNCALVAKNSETDLVWGIHYGKIADINSRTVLTTDRFVFHETGEFNLAYKEEIHSQRVIEEFSLLRNEREETEIPRPLFAPRQEAGKGEYTL